MNQALRMMVAAALVSLGFAGCGPCKCADGTRFLQDIPCEECFQGCAKLGSIPASCRFEELNANETLTPIPEATLSPNATP